MNRNNQSYLDNVWSAGGMQRLKRMFGDMARRDTQEALRQLNDEKLTFPVLFILMPEISAHRLYDSLSRRNLTAINICSNKIYKHMTVASLSDIADSDHLHQTLKWMFDSGKDWGGPNDGHDPYDSVIDYVAALLVITFDDKTILRDIASLIFKRNRQGLLIHDLVWSFFQTVDRDALAMIAGYLMSNNPRDTELAGRLLCIEPSVLSNRNDAQKTQRRFLAWLDENRPYLYLTGEHFQMSSKPKHLDADKEAKYLGKEITPRYKTPVEPLTDNEHENLRRYRESTSDEQALLTDYSHKLRGRDPGQWEAWMRKETAAQVLAARTTYEVI